MGTNATFGVTSQMDEFELPFQLDDYGKCMKISAQDSFEVATKYCLAEVQINNNISRYKNITWGLCVPVAADEEYIKKLLNQLLDSRLQSKYEIVFNECISPGKVIYGVDFYVIMFLQLILFVTVLFSTIYVRIYKQHIQSGKETLLTWAIKSFDANRNGIDLFETKAIDIKILHSMRFLSACLIVYLHLYLFHFVLGLIKQSDLDRGPENMHLAFVYHIHIAVDTLFLISGLLLSRSLLSNISKPVNIFKLMVKRYFRLMGCFINTSLICMLMLKYVAEGPLSMKYCLTEGNVCSKYWWRNILMIGNYIDTENMCYAISWSIPSDFHFTFVGALLFWLYQRNRRIAIKTFVVLFIASIVLPGVVTYAQHLHHSPSFDYDFTYNYRNKLLLMPTYLSSHLRIGPYLVGIVLGYILSVYKPTNYRNVMSKKSSIIAFFLILVVMVTILYVMELLHNRPYNASKAAVFAALHRTVWSLAIAGLVIICEYGKLPLVTSFLNSSIFVPLGRLSYGVYLANYMVILWEVISIQEILQHNLIYVFKRLFVILSSCVTFGFIQWFSVEAPLNNFVGFVLNRRIPAADIRKTSTKVDTDGQWLTNVYKKRRS